MTKTMKFLFIICILFGSNLHAQTLKPLTLKTQFGKEIKLDQNATWIFFTASKKGAELLQESFKKLKVDQALLVKKRAMVIADIHGMPRLITRFFALPKMRKLPYLVGLDDDGKKTKSWQHKGTVITVYQLKKLSVLQTRKLDSVNSINAFLKKFVR